MKIPVTPISMMNFFFMLGLAIVLTVDQNLFTSSEAPMYRFLIDIMPQLGHAIVAFSVAVLIFTAFVLRNHYLEMIGLFLSGIFMMFVLAASLLTFPNMGSIAYGIWTLATFMTINEVVNQIQDKKEEMK